MMTYRLPLIAFVILVASAGAATSADAAIWCGDLKTFYRENGTRQYVQAENIYADQMPCRKARQVARRWTQKSRLSYRPAKRSLGYRCHYFRYGSDVGTTVCWKRATNRRLIFNAYDSSPFH